jgi:TetR/AcrR family transcriptional regulator, repressor of the ameABC operon
MAFPLLRRTKIDERLFRPAPASPMLTLARGGASDMGLNETARAAERERIARHVLDLVKERGAEVPWTVAMAESGLTRARFEALFADYDDLFDAVAQTWLAPQLAVMEEVLASGLPPQRKMYEFFRRRFVISQERFRADPQFFNILCEMGAANFERVRSYVDLADHYLCELIAEAQAEGFFAGLEIDEALSLINQMISNYTLPDALIYLGDKLTEQKLARIVDTMFIGLSGEAGADASGVNALKVAS